MSLDYLHYTNLFVFSFQFEEISYKVFYAKLGLCFTHAIILLYLFSMSYFFLIVFSASSQHFKMSFLSSLALFPSYNVLARAQISSTDKVAWQGSNLELIVDIP